MLRLASLLWRLRRATAIETDLLRIQAEILRDRRSGQLAASSQNWPSPILGGTSPPVQDAKEDQTDCDPWQVDRGSSHRAPRLAPQPVRSGRELAHCFLRLANLDNGLFERLGRYESKLWRQMLQTLFCTPIRKTSLNFKLRFQENSVLGNPTGPLLRGKIDCSPRKLGFFSFSIPF